MKVEYCRTNYIVKSKAGYISGGARKGIPCTDPLCRAGQILLLTQDKQHLTSFLETILHTISSPLKPLPHHPFTIYGIQKLPLRNNNVHIAFRIHFPQPILTTNTHARAQAIIPTTV